MGLQTKISVGDVARLLELVSELAERDGCSTSQVVERVAQLASRPASVGVRPRTTVTEFIRQMRRLRVRRNELMGAPLFRDPAWDMLLELFVARDLDREMSVSSLCYASGVPPSTALRKIFQLEEHGLVSRTGDSDDNRRIFVRLTEVGFRRLCDVTEMLISHAGLPTPKAK